MADAPFLSPSWTESQGALSPAAFDCQTQGAPHLRMLVVLLQQQGKDAVGETMVSAEGGTCCCLQQFGTWPHQLHVRLTQMVPAI